MNRPARLLIAAAALFLTVPLSARAGETTVSGDWVTLGDVITVAGPQAERRIAAAPVSGAVLPLSPDFIMAQAQAAGVSLTVAPTQTVFVRRSNGSSGSQARLASLRDAARPPEPTVTRAAEPRMSPPPAPPTRRVIDHLPTGKAGEVPVLVETVQRGDVITADMVDWMPADTRRSSGNTITEIGDLVGQEATRTLRADRPVRDRDVRAASVVRKGDPVKLVYIRGGIRLSVNARALSNAARGEPVRVVNLQSNRSMDATATAPGEARILSAAQS